VRSLRRRDPPRLLVALLPLAGIAGYLYFTVSYPVPDGDVLKPTYMLSTLGAWALCFGWFASRAPRLVVGALVLAAALDLPFVIYRGVVG
jgi:4-hydroxybenzoate polyprenyltransferase